MFSKVNAFSGITILLPFLLITSFETGGIGLFSTTARSKISPIDSPLQETGILNTQDVFLPYDEKDFYLNEDLLDKQVILILDFKTVKCFNFITTFSRNYS
ncbi:MAG: hypothetical protein M1365_02035 [Actinobacteria bacterium]|nr:hypothetical protein [Actinomycetota bacterium]